MNILILGGNSYFGKKLVSILLSKGHIVTLLNRGNKDDGFGDKVKRIICDRKDELLLSQSITENYDIVFDQCCFDYDQAIIATKIFEKKAKRYIFTSSISAYNKYGADLKEEDMDPYSFSFDKKETVDSNYGEAKRQAEVGFFKAAKFPVVACRFPIVLDAEDTTERLQVHVHSIMNSTPIFFNNINAKISFISADDAARALYKVALTSFEGPINIASPYPIELKKFVEKIEQITGIKHIVPKHKTEENSSSYGIHEDWYMNCGLLLSLGIELDSIEQYLSVMIESIHKKLTLRKDLTPGRDVPAY